MMTKLKTIFREMTFKRIALALPILLLIGAAASAAVPGPHRALCPTCFGMVEIADGVFIDTNDDLIAKELRATLNKSEETIASYLGAYNGSPRILLCTQEEGACKTLFGNVGTRGTAWGSSLIRLNPEGLNETIMTHELVHVELGQRMGQWGMWSNAIPKWFNEGLAVYISGDDRFTYDYTRQEKIRAWRIVSYQDWRREVNADTWRPIYGASAQIVKEWEDQIGRDGILEIIRRVTKGGENFDVVAAELTAG